MLQRLVEAINETILIRRSQINIATNCTSLSSATTSYTSYATTVFKPSSGTIKSTVLPQLLLRPLFLLCTSFYTTSCTSSIDVCVSTMRCGGHRTPLV
jgi:hypothetical protein